MRNTLGIATNCKILKLLLLDMLAHGSILYLAVLLLLNGLLIYLGHFILYV